LIASARERAQSFTHLAFGPRIGHHSRDKAMKTDDTIQHNGAPAGHPGKRRPEGRYLELSLQRRWVGDLLAACLRTPVVAGEQTMRVGPAAAARRALRDPPGWTAIILKAYAIVAQRRPELRRNFLSFPRHRLYEHPCSVATVIVEREWNGELGLFMDQITAPENMTLARIDAIVHALRTGPVEASRGFRRQIGVTRLPRPLRRMLWWFALRVSARQHVKYFGTFSINGLLKSRRWNLVQTQTAITMSLTHAALEPPAQIRLCGAFDHRVFDGMPAGRALGEVESVINNELTAEMRAMAEAERAQPAAAEPA
jgi:hypothetical protein